MTSELKNKLACNNLIDKIKDSCNNLNLGNI